MPIARDTMEMLTLPSGQVFVGGGNVHPAGSLYIATDTLIYSPIANTWTNSTRLLFSNNADYLHVTGVLFRH